MDKFTELIIKLRWLIISLVILLSLFFGYQLKNIEVDSNILNALPKTDKDVQAFKEVGDVFGSNEIGMIIVKADNVLMPGVLEDVAKITDSLSTTEGITSVNSITNLMGIQMLDDDFRVDLIINDRNRPKNRQEADSLLKKLNKNEMIRGSILAADGSSTVVLFSFDGSRKTDSLTTKVMEKVKGIELQEKYYFAGAPFMREYVRLVIRHDLSILIPIAFVLISLILYLSFKSWRGVFLPILTAALAILWSMGTFAMMGMKLSMVTNNVPIILLAVGTAYAIHIINRVNHCREKDKKAAIRLSLKLMLVPVSLTALTTMVGFLSFIFGSYLSMIRDFGVLSALGTFYAALLALTFVPALLTLLKDKRNPDIPEIDKNSWLNKHFLTFLKEKVTKHPKRILLVWLIIFIISTGGILMLKRSVSVAGYLKKSHPVSISENILSKDYGGTKPIFIVFSGDIQSPEVLKTMMDFEDYLKESPLIGSTQSIADVLKALNKAITGDNNVPDNESAIGQLWFLVGQQESSERLVTPDADKALIIAKFQDIGDNSTPEIRQYMDKFIAAHKSEDYSISYSGMPFINEKLSDSLLYSQIMSLLISMIFVMAIVSAMLKSIRRGIYASLPILVTIGIIYGVMGYSGIPLNIATVLVASIAMGIGIDYSIHFFSYFNYSKQKGLSTKEAVGESIQVSGKAIIINFISVSVGFLVLIFSNLAPMIYFGIIIALSMLGASMGALTLLPSIFLLKKHND